MICKKCKHWNEDVGRFCVYCGAPLRKETVVTDDSGEVVTAFGVPTAGIRYFAGIGNPYLQVASMELRGQLQTHSEGITEHHTAAHVKPLSGGDWYCPDCGEKNHYYERICMGCGKDK